MSLSGLLPRSPCSLLAQTPGCLCPETNGGRHSSPRLHAASRGGLSHVCKSKGDGKGKGYGSLSASASASVQSEMHSQPPCRACNFGEASDSANASLKTLVAFPETFSRSTNYFRSGCIIPGEWSETSNSGCRRETALLVSLKLPGPRTRVLLSRRRGSESAKSDSYHSAHEFSSALCSKPAASCMYFGLHIHRPPSNVRPTVRASPRGHLLRLDGSVTCAKLRRLLARSGMLVLIPGEPSEEPRHKRRVRDPFVHMPTLCLSTLSPGQL